MRYGNYAAKFMEENEHMLTREAVEYAYVHGELKATDSEGTTITEGEDASGRRFQITVSANAIILNVRPM